jgi:hypothetical protein
MTPFNKLERTDIPVEPSASNFPEEQAIRLPKTSISRSVHLHQRFESDLLNLVIFCYYIGNHSCALCRLV